MHLIHFEAISVVKTTKNRGGGGVVVVIFPPEKNEIRNHPVFLSFGVDPATVCS